MTRGRREGESDKERRRMQEREGVGVFFDVLVIL